MGSATRQRIEPEHLGFDDLTADQLESIRERDFEHFCRALLEVERADRHPGALVRGPFKTKDGGKDLVFRPRGTPAMSKEEYERAWGLSLTEDHAPVCFSCKSGPNWKKTVLGEAKRPASGRIDGPLDFLREGGHFVVLVNQVPPTDRKYAPRDLTVIQELAQIFGKALGGSAADLEKRIRVVAADDLAAYLRRRKPVELGEKNLHRLGVARISCVRGVRGWRKDHQGERAWPQFVEDDSRRAIGQDLEDSLRTPPPEAAQRIFWIHGLPGVGKTRLVLDLLERSGGDDLLLQRTRIAFSASDGLEAIEQHRIFERYPSCILVVDDCHADYVGDLVRVFLRQESLQSGSALVLLTPGQVDQGDVEKQARRGVRVRNLPPLLGEARQQLIKSELGELAQAEAVEQVNRYSEGFPWYAALIARGLRDSPETPLYSAGETARLVLEVGLVREGSPEQKRIANERARCLMAAMLTNHVSWDDMAEDRREALCRALDFDRWQQLVERAEDCKKNGLLRIRFRRTFKYVTPQILAREVALMLLRPPDGDPHSPLGPRIRKYAPEYASSLFELLDRLDIGSDGEDPSIAELAYDVLDEIAAGADASILGKPGISGAPLRFAVRRAPGPAAARIRRLVEATPKEMLYKRGQYDLAWALEALSRRRASFDDAEATLFRLACEEKRVNPESTTLSSSAVSAWASLFLVELNPTYRTFADKLPLLRERCSDEDPVARLIALGAIEQAVTTWPSRRGGDETDGPYAVPKTYAEVREAKVAAWSLLLGLLDDVVVEVQEQARKVAIKHLRGAIRMGLADPVATMIAGKIDYFDGRHLVAIREQVEFVIAHDGEIIRRSGGEDAWLRLVREAAPRTFRERLRQGVGTWSYDEEDDPMGERVLVRLASEATSKPDLLIAELDWLDQQEAVRSVPFFIELGKQDATAVFLPTLIARTERAESADQISAYLKGQKEQGRAEIVEGVLRDFRERHASPEALALSIMRLGATEERMGWMVDLVAQQRLSEPLFRFMMFGSWERAASDASLRALVSALVSHGSAGAAATSLTLALRRVEPRVVVGDDWRSLLASVLDAISDGNLSKFMEHEWERGFKILAQSGLVEKATNAAVRALEKSEHPMTASHAWSVLVACQKQDPVLTWRIYARLLERKDAYQFEGHFGAEGFGESFPVEEVMRWVDGKERNAIAAARMCAPHSATLSPLVRALLIRFGPDSKVAHELAARARTTPSARHSLADFYREQALNAQKWASDPHPHVRLWAQKIQKSSEMDVEMHDAYEEHERLRWA